LKTRSLSPNARTETCIVKKQSGDKINTILLGALAALTEKGYTNTTIDHMARASNVSRGLLHYYFESKEDLVMQAVSRGSGALFDSAIARIGHASSTEHLADIMIEVLRQTVEQHPTITALLIEVWGESRRSAKLRIAFEAGFKETTEKLASFLAPYVSAYSNPAGPRSVEVTSRILLGLYQGLVIQMISQPDLLNDSQFHDALRSVVVHTLRNPSHLGD
jgi:AcrR family transcriptional regulator